MTSGPGLSARGHSPFLLREQPSLDWAADGDEFLRRLRDQLAEVTGVPVAGLFMTTVPFERDGSKHWYRRYTFSGPTLATALAGLPLKDGGWLLAVEATDISQAETEARVWVAAIRGARASMGGTSHHPWWAVVAPTSPLAAALVLNGNHTLSEITLEQPLAPYVRYARLPRPRGLGGGGQAEVIYPVVAAGTAVGYQADVAMRLANAQLIDLCAALTLDTGVFWEIIETPQPSKRELASLPSAEDASLQLCVQDNWEASEVTPSGFAAETVAKMHADSDVTELVAAFYHGHTIEQDSPSLAAVIYVSVVEAIGARWVSLSKCRCCEQCDQYIGYARRFREALKLVLASEDAKRLGRMYNKRSKTAHQGALHGTELRLWSTPNTFIEDPADSFRYQELWYVRVAAGRLLRLLVEDQLPPPGVSDQ